MQGVCGKLGRGTRVLARGEDTHACRLRASSTRSARGMRTHSFACAQKLSASKQVPLPRIEKNRLLRVGLFLAAELGFEPRHTESESAVLPLHNSAKFIALGFRACIFYHSKIDLSSTFDKNIFLYSFYNKNLLYLKRYMCYNIINEKR